MALFTLPIADADVPRVVSALCANFGYTDVTPENAMAGVIKYISDVVASREAITAQEVAIASIPDAIEISFIDDTPIVVPPVVVDSPVTAFTADVTTGVSPLVVTLTDTSTGTPTSWAWDLGDGTTSIEQNPVVTYSTVGDFIVSLTATNAGGSGLAATQTVTVTA